MSNGINVYGLSKQYRTKNDSKAVNDLTFSIPSGNLFGLIGADGAGKTTTLRILSTVMEASAGDINVLGIDIRKKPEKVRPLIGYMPQNFSLYPDLSVIENLRFFADLNNLQGNKREERISKMLKFTRLDRFQSRRAANLSGGMKKKLALACALVHDPRILLLDEPSTGVDPLSRRELWVMLAEVVARGVTILVSTPYMDEAERCTQVGILHKGRMLTIGAPDELERNLPFDIIEVKAHPRKKMRRTVEEMEGITDWRPVGDRLRLSVPNHNEESRKILKKLDTNLHKADTSIHILRIAKKTIEDVFTYSVQTQRSGA
ncbi:MAG: ABC transporter ATP-binding protein [Anaerolineales bacterium]|jgi:ABC-2 type transport system ATP-binding protein